MELVTPDLSVHGSRLLAIQRLAYRVEADLIGDDRIPTLHESLAELRAAPLTWRVALVDGAVVGALGWTATGSELDIGRLFVAPSAVRRGIGRALVTTAIAAAGVRAVLVSTGRANAPALALYDSLGFVTVGDVEVLDGLWIRQLRRPPAPGCPEPA